MPVTLDTFVERFGLRVLAGAGRTGRIVRWVHVSELPDPSPYLRGGELLLLAGANLTGGREECARYVGLLADTGVVGVGFGVTPVHDTVPPALVDACQDRDLPLLEVPHTLAFESVGELLYAEMMADELSTIKRFAEAQRDLTGAATGPAAMRTTLRKLASHIDGWALMVDRNRRREWSGGEPRLDEAAYTALERIASGSRPGSASVTASGQHILVYWIPGPLPSGYALAVGTASPLDVTGRAVVATAASVLPLLLTAPADSWQSHEVGALLVRASVSAGESVGRDAVGLLAAPEDLWRVVHCLPAPGRRRARPDDGPTAASVLATPFVAPSADAIVAICPAGADLGTSLPELARLGWMAGASRPHPWSDLRIAALEAASAARAAVLSGTPVVDRGERTGVFALTDAAAARVWADRTLEPLHTRRTGEDSDLLTTLRTWLARHGNWDRTASDLGIHRNSVRNRVGRISRLLDRDLADPNARMELWFALHWAEAPSAGGPPAGEHEAGRQPP